ncbi:hypothetical protein KCH_47740 [Kitasatospora cheerisanensis KCTC 2395]|uniref:Uncharacterized protein n=1 Tax=Kitasatospora cheerisanensis KCTC 2395 TaxID=1348663 RepID=A0A066YPZ1_9ACTN|nr:hypothetical protein KCH_47740 [Kitasatospora cheerisanensis KCTC 2395]
MAAASVRRVPCREAVQRTDPSNPRAHPVSRRPSIRCPSIHHRGASAHALQRHNIDSGG